MRQLTIILAAMMIFLTLGCEKRVGQAEDADRFDEKIDGPTCVLTVSADENLLADQKKISRQARSNAESFDSEEKTDAGDTRNEDTTPSPTPTRAVQQVRQTMANLISTYKAGQIDELPNTVAGAEATLLRNFCNGVDKLIPKRDSLMLLFSTKLGMAPPPDVKDMKMKTSLFIPILGINFDQVSLEKLKFEQINETVVVTGPGVTTVTFSKIGQDWKIQLGPDAKQLTGLLGDITATLERMTDEIISGINNGSVTKDNHRAKMDEIEQKHGAVIGAKIETLMSNLQIPVSSASISAIKQVLGVAIAAAKAGQTEQILGVYTDKDAAALRPIITAINEFHVKLAAFEKAIQRKLGTRLADSLSLMMTADGVGPVFGDFLDLDIKALTFEREGDKVFVRGSKDVVLTLINTSRGWRLHLYPFERQMFGIYCEMYIALNKAIDEITTGVNSGAITRQNGKAKVDEILGKHVKPAREKLNKFFEKTSHDTPDSAKPKPPAKPVVVPRRRPDEERRRHGPERSRRRT